MRVPTETRDAAFKIVYRSVKDFMPSPKALARHLFDLTKMHQSTYIFYRSTTYKEKG